MHNVKYVENVMLRPDCLVFEIYAIVKRRNVSNNQTMDTS